MKKTLILNYTPRVGSNTKKMLDHFIDINKDKSKITVLDLSEDTPDLLLKENLNIYVMRNFGGVALNDEQTKILAKNDRMAQQLIDTDYVVLACPMFNFSVPATVKAWFDGVVQGGKTFTYGENGPVGLVENTKALLLMTSGSDFTQEPLSSMNHATPLVTSCFGIMGIPTEAINVFGTQQYADKLDVLIEESKGKIDALSARWY